LNNQKHIENINCDDGEVLKLVLCVLVLNCGGGCMGRVGFFKLTQE